MARTRTNLRQLTARQFPLPYSFISATSDGSATTTTLIDADTLGQFADDQLIGMWIYDSARTPDDYHITDSAQSTGTVTFIPTANAAPNSEAYEILPFSATAIHYAIDEALLQAYDEGILVRSFWDKSVVAASPIFNAGWQHWLDSPPNGARTSGASGASHGPIGWTGINATVVLQTGDQYQAVGEAGIGLIRTSGGSVGQLVLGTPWRRFLADFMGNTVTLYCWVRTPAPSHARIGLAEVDSAGTTSSTYSDYHTGSGNGYWERLSVELPTTSTSLDLAPLLEVADTGSTAYFADMWIDGGGYAWEHPIVTTKMPQGPMEVFVVGAGNSEEIRQLGRRQSVAGWGFFKHYDEQASTETGVLTLPGGSGGRRLWLRADGPLTLPQSDTENIELTEFEGLLVAKMAALTLVEGRLSRVVGSAATKLARLSAKLTSEIGLLKTGKGSNRDSAALRPDWLYGTSGTRDW